MDESDLLTVQMSDMINLSLVKEDTVKDATVQESIDTVIGEKEQFTYHDIFRDYGKYRFILVVGRPGSGKTVLLKQIGQDWANEKILQLKLLIFVQLRHIGKDDKHDLTTILQQSADFSQSELDQLHSFVMSRSGDGVVFAFDGLDEYNPVQRNDAVIDIMKGRKLVKANIIVTSRPAASQEFYRFAKLHLEVIGFLKPQVVEYIHTYFEDNKEKALQLVTHLEHHTNLMNMCYLPLHCAMLASLYEGDNNDLPVTETEFYKHFTISMLLRSFDKREITSVKQIREFNQLPSSDKILFDKVCRLAFHATVDSKQIFKQSELLKLGVKFEVDSKGCDKSSLGLVVIGRNRTRYGLEDTYTFVHLTFQEYLSAVYLSELNKIKQQVIIKTTLANDKKHFSVVWKFLCGMMNFRHDQQMETFKVMVATPSKSDILHLIQCAYETQHKKPCAHLISLLNGTVDIQRTHLSSSDCAAIGYVIKNAEYLKPLSIM